MGISNKFKKQALKMYVKVKENSFKHNGTAVKHMFTKANSEVLIVSFSGFSANVPRYNYVRTLNKLKVNKLFILDDGGYDGYGSYYIGRDGNFNEEKATSALIEEIKSKNGIKKVIFVGSSKGGYASLYFGFKHKVDSIIVGAPQYLLGRYVTIESMHPELVKYITGKDNQVGVEMLDRLLPNILEKNKNFEAKIYLQYSKKDHTYEGNIKLLINDLLENKIRFETQEYEGEHSEISKHFPSFLLNNLDKELKKETTVLSS